MVNKLTKEEKEILDNMTSQFHEIEMNQVMDLVANCDNKFQFAKTHSTYIKDWEKTKKYMQDKLSSGNLPPNTSKDLFQAIISESDKIIQDKLKKVQFFFETKFGESIFNYLGKDGKTKKIFGLF